jgi:TatD DNase family protein
VVEWFDSHCHVYECEDPDGAIERARATGVVEMLVAGADLDSSRSAIALASRGGVYAAAGVHPNESTSWDDATAAALENLVSAPEVVAVGETGLDFYRTNSPPRCQRRAFRAHIDLARSTGRALVVHTRDSVDAALEALEGTGPPERVVFHCWSGDGRQMQRALALRAFISFAGNVTWPRARELRELAAAVPDGRLVVETDAPYLAPAPYRGRRNEPAYVAAVGAVVAEARAAAVSDLAALTAANARRLYGLGSDSG